MRAAAAAAALVLAGALPGAPAQAADATRSEVRALAAAAPSDPAALARLRAVDRVDGRPVALGRALRGDPRQVRARLRVLAAEAGAGTAAAPDGPAAADARDILSERRFRGSSLPQPLRRPLERLGIWLDDLVRALDDLLPGGRALVWALLAGAVLLLAAALARRAVRRAVAGEARTTVSERRAGEDPRVLEREADAAERAGDPARAIRLRFRAGLIVLDAAGAIELRPGLTTGAIARTLGSPAFDALRTTFDAVAYGDRRPGPGDAEQARELWRRILSEHRPRRSPRTLERAA